VGRRWVAWDYNVRWLNLLGFKVEEAGIDKSWSPEKFGTYIKDHTADKTLEGLYFWGHGNTDHICLDATTRVAYKDEALARDEAYRLGLGLLFSCGSQD
jgi:hypothetical protein